MTEGPLWTPNADRQAQSNLRAFIERINGRFGLALSNYDDIHGFSISQPENFWSELWDFCEVISKQRGSRILLDTQKMQGARFFPDAQLNYAENLLRRCDETPALIFQGEDKVRRRMTWNELNAAVARLHRGLAGAGIRAGDRVCAVVPNMPETIVCFLAVASLGAIWSSCSPDFGERGILDRFGQIAPRVLVLAMAITMPARPSAWPKKSPMS